MSQDSRETVRSLLAPYSEALDRIRERSRTRTSLAEALIIREAEHVAEVRAGMTEPSGGWKNKLPLEHATLLGLYISELRTGERIEYLGLALDSKDAAKRARAQVLVNSQSIYVDGADQPDWRNLSTDRLIDNAIAEFSTGLAE